MKNLLNEQQWVRDNFGGVELGDARLERRLERLAHGVVSRPGEPLSRQVESGAELKAAYRLVHNRKATAEQIQRVHRERTLEQCRQLGVILSVQDHTCVSFTDRQIKRLGLTGDGRGRGVMLHSSLAVSEQGELLGLLQQRWYTRKRVERGESARQRAKRWSEKDVWADSAEELAQAAGAGLTIIQVADRESDCFKFISRVVALGQHLVVRAQHDRPLAEGVSLWEKLALAPSAGRYTVAVRLQKTGRNPQAARQAQLQVRYAKIELPAPAHDPQYRHTKPLCLWAVWASEPPACTAEKPLEWMLLTSLPVDSFEQAQRILTYYKHRWVIEQWHRCVKQGCGLEEILLQDLDSLQRLGAILSVVAVRLLQLRDCADSPQSDQVLIQPLQILPEIHLQLIAHKAHTTAAKLSLRQFWITLAKMGGWLAPKAAARPGWIVIWRGWHELSALAAGAELYAKLNPRCVL